MDTKISYQEVLENCIQSEQVRELIKDKEILVNNLRKPLLEKESVLIRQINSDLDEIEKRENRNSQLWKEYDKSKKKSIFHLIITIAFFLILIGCILALLSFLWDFPFGFNSISKYFQTINIQNSIFSFILIIIIGSFLFLQYKYSRKKTRIKNFSSNDKNGWYYNVKELESFISNTKEKLCYKVILPEIKLLISEISKPNYDTNFKTVTINSLNSDYNEEFEILTEEFERLGSFLNNMQSGTIGISGPRGIGKSTLLKSFYNSTDRVSDEKKVLPVLTSAPVKYQIRDFTIHLFTLVANKVLSSETKTDIDDSQFEENGFKERVSWKLLKRFGVYLLILGFIFIGLQVSNTYVNNKIDQHNASQTLSTKKLPHRDLFKDNYLLIWGMIFLTGAILIIYNNRIIKLKSNIKTSELENLANRWKRKLKFQMGYTTGWSGNFKSPIGFEFGKSSSINFAQNQLSYPEIVEGFKSFIDIIGSKYKVIIAIDELDKIFSSQDLNMFLNEVKALFEVHECVFLISISEEATNSFLKGDISVKDVLDSSFDEIFKLNHFNFQQTRKFIQKRIYGIPLSFILFIHLYSGGNPREILRTIRRIIHNDNQDKVEFADKIKEVVITDIKNKLEILYYEHNILFADYESIDFNQLDYIKAKEVASNITKTLVDIDDDSLKTEVLRLYAYILYQSKIGGMLSDNYNFKEKIENSDPMHDFYTLLRNSINLNPIFVIKQLLPTFCISNGR